MAKVGNKILLYKKKTLEKQQINNKGRGVNFGRTHKVRYWSYGAQVHRVYRLDPSAFFMLIGDLQDQNLTHLTHWTLSGFDIKFINKGWTNFGRVCRFFYTNAPNMCNPLLGHAKYKIKILVALKIGQVRLLKSSFFVPILRQLRNSRHLLKCSISAIACDIISLFAVVIPLLAVASGNQINVFKTNEM